MKFALAAVLAALLAGAVWLAAPSFAEPCLIDVQASGGGDYHVFPPGQGFSVTVTSRLISGAPPDELDYQWVDFRGRPLAAPVSLELGKTQTIPSPSEDMAVGYYGLKLLPEDGSVTFNPESGERPEIGFAVLPKVEPRTPDPSSRFGIVHFDADDPFLDPGWMKTTTEVQAGWNGRTVDTDAWHALLAAQRARGQIELPLILGDTWKTGSLEQIRTMMGAIFRADPGAGKAPVIPAYELGIEENLNAGDYGQALAHTAEKFATVQKEKASVSPSVKLLYQVAGTDLDPYEKLFGSPLAAKIDVLAAHPYPWNGWPTPDKWHDKLVDDIRAAMAAKGLSLPIWYTEVGAVQNDADASVILSGLKPTGRGLTRADYAAYLVKLHAHAFAKGIERVFWYNYRDRTTATTDAEAHFGLRDYWGFPKPGYLAYAAAIRCMKGRTASEIAAPAGVKAYRFSGADQDCIAAWTYPDATKTVSLDAISTGLSPEDINEAFDTVGAPVQADMGSVELSSYPTFLMVRTAGTPR